MRTTTDWWQWVRQRPCELQHRPLHSCSASFHVPGHPLFLLQKEAGKQRERSSEKRGGNFFFLKRTLRWMKRNVGLVLRSRLLRRVGGGGKVWFRVSLHICVQVHLHIYTLHCWHNTVKTRSCLHRLKIAGTLLVATYFKLREEEKNCFGNDFHVLIQCWNLRVRSYLVKMCVHLCVCVCVEFAVMSGSFRLKQVDRGAVYETGFRAWTETGLANSKTHTSVGFLWTSSSISLSGLSTYWIILISLHHHTLSYHWKEKTCLCSFGPSLLFAVIK